MIRFIFSVLFFFFYIIFTYFLTKDTLRFETVHTINIWKGFFYKFLDYGLFYIIFLIDDGANFEESETLFCTVNKYQICNYKIAFANVSEITILVDYLQVPFYVDFLYVLERLIREIQFRLVPIHPNLNKINS
jgi:hypothetical protein